MSSEYKFRVLTSEDWKEVVENENLFDKEGLRLKALKKDGSYTSKTIDSGIPDCRWHRIVLDADIPENSTLTIFVNTSNNMEAVAGGSEGIVFKNAKDALILALPGRYIRLRIDFHREDEKDPRKSPVLKEVKVYFQRLSYLRYLPAIYQENGESRDFLERFLSIFESSLYDSDETITSIQSYFDPMAAPEEFYRWLADWMSLDLYDLLDESRKREYILRAVEFYKQKGTVSGLASLVSFLTGKRCCIKEYKNNIFRSWGMEHVEDNEIKDDEKADIIRCRNNADKNKPECTRFYRSTSRTFTREVPGLLENRGKYCDEIHYVTGTWKKQGTNEQINYFPNSIGIFVFFPFMDELLIKKEQLIGIIGSFLPVFVKADIIFAETPLEEAYLLGLIGETYTDAVEAPIRESIGTVTGEYIDNVTGWKRFYSYDPGLPPDAIGHTFAFDTATHVGKYKNYRTVHGSIGFPIYI